MSAAARERAKPSLRSSAASSASSPARASAISVGPRRLPRRPCLPLDHYRSVNEAAFGETPVAHVARCFSGRFSASTFVKRWEKRQRAQPSALHSELGRYTYYPGLATGTAGTPALREQVSSRALASVAAPSSRTRVPFQELRRKASLTIVSRS